MLHSSFRRAPRRPARAVAGGALLALAGGLLVAPAVAAPAAALATPYTQDFETAGTPSQAPDGWSVESANTAGMRAGWEGWTFHTPAEVVSAFGNSGDRNGFGKAQGLVAVVHSDSNRPATGTFDSTLWAPAYAVDPGAAAVTISFDSHYKQGQAPQEAKLLAKIDGGDPVLVEQFGTNRLNQTHTFAVDLPSGAQNVQFGWQYLKSTNNWFWMIDNVSIAEAAPADRTPAVISNTKAPVAPGSTATVEVGGLRPGQQLEASFGGGPVSGIPAAGADGAVSFGVAIPADQPNGTIPLLLVGDGVVPVETSLTVLAAPGDLGATTEPQLWFDGFEGAADAWQAEGAWQFTTRADVVASQGTDRRQAFTRASGTIAVAEASTQPFAGALTSAPVEVSAGAKLELRFDSHLRVRGSGGTAVVRAVFDTGETIVLRTMTENEESAQPRLPLTVPDGASTVRFALSYEAPAGGGSWMLDDLHLVQPLPQLPADAEAIARIDVFSDVQGANARLQNNVMPGFERLPGGRAGVLLSNGDQTSQGTESQYNSYLAAVQGGGGAEYPTVVSTIGNHEFYGGNGSDVYIQRFLDRTGMRGLGVEGSTSPNTGLWGEVLVDGELPLLWIGSEYHDYPSQTGSGPFVVLSDEQFDWLRARLEHYSAENKPVVLASHHVFADSNSGTYINFNRNDFDRDTERLQSLLAAHPNVTVLTSHTHWSAELNDWSVEQRFDPAAELAPTIVNTAAVTTQYGPSGDWGETGIGGADPVGLRAALYEDRLRVTAYYFDGNAVEREIKHIDVALPAEAPAAPPEVSLGAGTVVQGGEVTVTGAGFLPSEPLRIELHSAPVVLATTAADAQGGLAATVRIPAGTPAGRHSLVVVRADGTELSMPIVVRAAEGGTGGGPGGSDGTGPGGAGSGDTGGQTGGGAGDAGRSGSADALSRTGSNGPVGVAIAVALLIAGGSAMAVRRLRRRA